MGLHVCLVPFLASWDTPVWLFFLVYMINYVASFPLIWLCFIVYFFIFFACFLSLLFFSLFVCFFLCLFVCLFWLVGFGSFGLVWFGLVCVSPDG